MRRAYAFLTLAVVILTLGAASGLPPAAMAQTEPIAVSVTTDKGTYAPGEEVRFALQVRNVGSGPVTVTRPTAQAFDFVVRHAGPRPVASNADTVWSWSANRQFALAAEQMTLEPGRTLMFSETWDQRDGGGHPVGPGNYTVQGIFITNQNIQPALRQFTIGSAAQPGLVTTHVTAEKESYGPGEEVRFTLHVRNAGTTPVTITRPTAQAFDFVVRRAGQPPTAAVADQLWAWSDNKRFALVAERMTIEPGRVLTFSETWDQRDKEGRLVGPGTYTVQGIFITEQNIQPSVDTFAIRQGSPPPAQQSITVALNGATGSSVRGTARLTAQGDGTQVVLDVLGLPAGARAEVRLHAGVCALPSASAAQLPDLTADAGGRAQAAGQVLFRGSEPVSFSTLREGSHIITVSLPGRVIACGRINGTTPLIPAPWYWLDRPGISNGATGICPQGNQWVLLYWGGVPVTIVEASSVCPISSRYWTTQSGRWLGFSSTDPIASDVWTMQTGEAAFARGISGGN